MSCNVIVRGNTVEFSATFYDASGAVFTPATAVTYVTYDVAGVATTDTVTLTASGDVWTGTWDSSVADAGTVYWHTQSSGSPSGADDGSFTLSANAANPQV